MQRTFANRGFSLIGALLVVLIISMTIAVIGSVFIKSQKIGHGVKVFKTTKEAAEATATSIISAIDNGTLTLSPSNCPDCSATGCGVCKVIDLNGSGLGNLVTAVENSPYFESGSVSACLISNCTAGGKNIYTIKVTVSSKDGSKTTIYFIYQK